MFSESKFSDLTESLASGFFADKVILTLARFQKTKELNGNDVSVFLQVVEFFKKVIAGHNWLDNPQLSRNSVESASYFSQVVRAMSPSVSSKDFDTYIKDLQDTANKLATERMADNVKVENLSEFFSNYGLSELVRTENLLQDDRLEIFG